MSRPTIAILGGGVAGMSAAHELGERGFSVSVYETKDVPGGKSRSVDVPDSAKPGFGPLPGEHGFRFFPRFYKHVTDTMARIPVGEERTAFDNLVDTTTILMPQDGKPAIETVAKFPMTLADFEAMVEYLKEDFKLTNPHNAEIFGWHVLRFATSCAERRMQEYERIVWWDFIDADDQDAEYKSLFAHGITRSLVAAKANLASTRTIGAIFLQLQLDILMPGTSSDRILNAPTRDAWTSHWYDYLTGKLGVDYHLSTTLKEILFDDERITGAIVVGEDGAERTITADHYVLAVPVEKASPLLNGKNKDGKAVSDLDPSLQSLDKLVPYTEWMNGLQIYLTGEDVPINHGHAIFVDSKWALTTVSQHQFWKGTELSKLGDGTVVGIVSVDVSDWEAPGNADGPSKGKRAKDCTEQEIKDEVWFQLKKSLNVEGAQPLKDEHVHSMYLDHDIVFFDKDGTTCGNNEPLLVNYVNTWSLRPRADTMVPNLFLAADYVQTTTDLATMEGANEAARRATNSILAASRSVAKPCRLFPMVEPMWLEPFKALDKIRFEAGLPHALKHASHFEDLPGETFFQKALAVLEDEASHRARGVETRVIEEVHHPGRDPLRLRRRRGTDGARRRRDGGEGRGERGGAPAGRGSAPIGREGVVHPSPGERGRLQEGLRTAPRRRPPQ